MINLAQKIDFSAAKHELSKVEGVDVFLVFYSILKVILSLFCTSLETFLRRNFGERYYSITIICMSFGALLSAISFGSIAQEIRGGHGFSYLLLVFAFSFLIGGIYHKYCIIKRKWRPMDEHVYSYSTGESWGFLIRIIPVSETTLQIYIEPAICLVIGAGLYVVDPAFSIFLMVSSLALYAKGSLIESQKRDAYLDALDNMVRNEHFPDAIHNKPKSKTKGFSLSWGTNQTPQEKQGLVEAFQALDPSLKNLMAVEAPKATETT